MATEFKLPELGENVEKGDVTRVLVAVGDVVKVDQSVVEPRKIDKATIEVPTSVAGARDGGPREGRRQGQGRAGRAGDRSNGGRCSGRKDPRACRTCRRARCQAVASARVNTARGRGHQHGACRLVARARGKACGGIGSRRSGFEHPGARPGEGRAAPTQPRCPRRRRSAGSRASLGLNITDVAGTGPGGRIGPEDVKESGRRRWLPGQPWARRRGAQRCRTSKWGEVEVKPMSNIRRKTAEHLSLLGRRRT